MEINQDSPRFVFERAGIVYRGEQETMHGPNEYVFDAADGSTLQMEGPVTPARIAEKLAEHDEIVRRAKC